MSQTIKINNQIIGEGQPAYIIAEIGINHNGDLNLAKELIDQAKAAEADAAKLQTYITEKRVKKDSPIFDILKKCELSFVLQKQLFDYAKEKGIEVFSTPFDDESVDFLSSINVACYKIASFDLVNTLLLGRIVAQGKTVIVSRGMANQVEIDKAISIIRRAKVPFALLHCVSAYPVKSYASLNLRTIQVLKSRYNCPAGFSDHTFGGEIPGYAVAAGAKIIEKHFTLSRKNNAPDNPISLEPQELKEMVSSIRKIEEMMGEACWSSVSEEKDVLQYRRMT